RIRQRFREAITRSRREGLTVSRTDEADDYQEFIRMYHETMRRVGAADSYFFGEVYFARLRQALGARLHLFLCRDRGAPIGGGLFMACDGILQYHLGATADAALKSSPAKLIVDEVRIWAHTNGFRVLHLGGGTTSAADDSLLHFKRGFSDRTHEASVWRWVVFPEQNARLCAEK